jgi:hypothetical protein
MRASNHSLAIFREPFAVKMGMLINEHEDLDFMWGQPPSAVRRAQLGRF